VNHSHLQISPAAKNVLKLTLALPGCVLGVLGVHLQIFSVNYAYKFFSPPKGHAHCTPWLHLWSPVSPVYLAVVIAT